MPEQENVQTATLEAKATLRYARISSRKVKIVADLIRGKKVDEALAIVKFTPKASSEIIEKLLKSAIANAENNHFMNRANLYVAEIYAESSSGLTAYVATVLFLISGHEIVGKLVPKGYTAESDNIEYSSLLDLSRLSSEIVKQCFTGHKLC